MTRRALLALFAGAAVAGTREDALDVLMRLAAALSAGDSVDFMRFIGRDAPDRADLKVNVEALTAQADVTCSVEVVRVEGDAVDADWYMEVRPRTPGLQTERRREVLKVRVSGPKLVTAIAPVRFFEPPRVAEPAH